MILMHLVKLVLTVSTPIWRHILGHGQPNSHHHHRGNGSSSAGDYQLQVLLSWKRSPSGHIHSISFWNYDWFDRIQVICKWPQTLLNPCVPQA